MAGSSGNDMFKFLIYCQTIFQGVWLILHSHWQWMRIPIALHSVVMERLFNCNHSKSYVFLHPYGFDMHFSNAWWCCMSCHVLICDLYVFLGEVCLYFCPYFNWGFFFYFLRMVYIFWVQILYQVFQGFPQSVACLFIPSALSFKNTF